MDPTHGNARGDRTRAAFGHLAPIAAIEPPRRAARIRAGLATALSRQPLRAPLPDTVPAPPPTPDDVPASRLAATDETALDAPDAPPPGRTIFDGHWHLARYGVMAAMILLVGAYTVRKLRPHGIQPDMAAVSGAAVAGASTTAPRPFPAVAEPPAQTRSTAQAATQTTEPAAPAVRRRQANFVEVTGGNAAMAAAIDKARASLPSFWEHATRGAPGETDFALKVALPTRTGTLEHIWAAIDRRDGDAIAVRLSNDPVDIDGVTRGSRVTVREARISDWMFRRNGRIVGAETLRVLIATMPPAEAARYRAMLAP